MIKGLETPDPENANVIHIQSKINYKLYNSLVDVCRKLNIRHMSQCVRQMLTISIEILKKSNLDLKVNTNQVVLNVSNVNVNLLQNNVNINNSITNNVNLSDMLEIYRKLEWLEKTIVNLYRDNKIPYGTAQMSLQVIEKAKPYFLPQN